MWFPRPLYVVSTIKCTASSNVVDNGDNIPKSIVIVGQDIQDNECDLSGTWKACQMSVLPNFKVHHKWSLFPQS